MPEEIIGGYCIINIKYAADSFGSIHRTEIAKKSTMCKTMKKTINTNCKDIGCMVVSKIKSIRCELQNEDNKIQQELNFKYLGMTLTDDGKSNVEEDFT